SRRAGPMVSPLPNSARRARHAGQVRGTVQRRVAVSHFAPGTALTASLQRKSEMTVMRVGSAGSMSAVASSIGALLHGIAGQDLDAPRPVGLGAADDVAAQAEAAGLLLGVLARGEARANLLHRPAPIGSSRWWSYSLPHSSTQTSAASSRSRARTRLPPASASI